MELLLAQAITTITIDPTQLESQWTGHIVTRNSKPIKIIPIIAEQYLSNQLIQHTDDPLDKIFKQYETLSPDKVQSSTSNNRREEAYMNKHSDI